MKKIASELMKIAAELSNEELDSLSSDGKEFVGEFGVELAKKIIKELGYDLIDIDGFKEGHDKDYMLEIGNKEWLGFKTSDDAEEFAVERVKSDLEDDPSMFTEDWLMGHIDEKKAEKVFREMFEESDRSYAEDIKSERGSRGHNRLVEEMIDRGIIDEEEADKEDFDEDDKIDEFVEKMVDDKIEEGNGGYDHYESNFGKEAAKKVLFDENLIDIDSAAQDAVDTDGIAHFLAGYDGNETEVDNTVWYRNN